MPLSTLPPPSSLRDCIVNGKIDVNRWFALRRKRRYANSHAILQSIIDRHRRRSTEPVEEVLIKRQHYRSVKKYKILVRDSANGGTREIKPTDTLWYLLYIETSPRNSRLLKLFRQRFRLPHHSFLELANEISQHKLFARWSSGDCTGVASSKYH
mmetsp:Transcript_29947/g.34790  ORF Transcript_29947/g.34790 Transcript_29947/m.34790 type:complete len:155 (-) Transcript_29947:485-949(-)